jgi:arylsulfatase A-like enzyme
MAMVNYLDDMVGQVVAALKKKGMWDNLLWTTNSDNVSHDLFSKENNEYSVFMHSL